MNSFQLSDRQGQYLSVLLGGETSELNLASAYYRFKGCKIADGDRLIFDTYDEKETPWVGFPQRLTWKDGWLLGDRPVSLNFETFNVATHGQHFYCSLMTQEALLASYQEAQSSRDQTDFGDDQADYIEHIKKYSPDTLSNIIEGDWRSLLKQTNAIDSHSFVAKLDDHLKKFCLAYPFEVVITSYDPNIQVAIVEKKTRRSLSLKQAIDRLNS
jgi:hypothetical protein